MKSAIIPLVFLMVSCGRIDNPVNDRIGGLRGIEPVTIEGNSLTQLRSACAAIAQKSPEALANLPVAFEYVQFGCMKREVREKLRPEEYPKPETVETTIQNTPAGYKFVLPGGSFFYFSDIETESSGSLASVCDAVTSPNVTSPIVSGAEYLYFGTNVSRGDCPVKDNQVCISLEKASVQTGSSQARIHTREWIRINLDKTRGRGGFFTLKRLVSSAGCPENQEMAHSAELK